MHQAEIDLPERRRPLDNPNRGRRRHLGHHSQLGPGLVPAQLASSFILTDLEGDAAGTEHWHRQRAQIEQRVREVKLGDRLLHFPLGTLDANRVWQTAGVRTRRVSDLPARQP